MGHVIKNIFSTSKPVQENLNVKIPEEIVSSTETGVVFKCVTLSENGTVVGHATLKSPGEHLQIALVSQGYDKTQVVEICQLAVAEKFRGQGIGSALLEHVEREAVELGKIPALMVYGWNTTAISMYIKRNYQEIGRLQNDSGVLIAMLLND